MFVDSSSVVCGDVVWVIRVSGCWWPDCTLEAGGHRQQSDQICSDNTWLMWYIAPQHATNPSQYTITINSTSVVDKNFYTLYLKGVLKIVGFRDIKIMKSFISQFDIHNTRLINWRSMKKSSNEYIPHDKMCELYIFCCRINIIPSSARLVLAAQCCAAVAGSWVEIQIWTLPSNEDTEAAAAAAVSPARTRHCMQTRTRANGEPPTPPDLNFNQTWIINIHLLFCSPPLLH